MTKNLPHGGNETGKRAGDRREGGGEVDRERRSPERREMRSGGGSGREGEISKGNTELWSGWSWFHCLLCSSRTSPGDL